MPIYMRFTPSNGQAIKGDVTAAGHAGWINLSSTKLGVGRTVRNPLGSAVNPKPAPPPVQDITITKDQDAASPELFKQSLWGKPATVQIDFVQSEKGKETTYLSVTLEGALIGSYAITPGGGAAGNLKPTDTLTINAAKITYDMANAGRLVPGEKATP